MRVLGIDPGLTRCGLGVVEQLPGQRPRFLGADVIRTEPTTELALRLVAIEAGIMEWVERFSPDVMAVEKVFAQQNRNTVTGTAQAAGIALLIGGRAGIPVVLHTPTEVKAAVTGSGRAGKDQVAAMVVRILALKSAPKPADAADATALALCHLWRGGMTNRYAAAVVQHEGTLA